jgi:hypothetical protein
MLLKQLTFISLFHFFLYFHTGTLSTTTSATLEQICSGTLHRPLSFTPIVTPWRRKSAQKSSRKTPSSLSAARVPAP